MSRTITLPSFGAEAVATAVTGTFDDMVHFPHQFICVSYFDDAAMTIPAVPTAGSIAAEFQYKGMQGWVTFANSPIDCTDIGKFVDAAGPIVGYRLTPTGITGATHYKVTVTGSES